MRPYGLQHLDMKCGSYNAGGAIQSREVVSRDTTVPSCRHHGPRYRGNRCLEAPLCEQGNKWSDGCVVLVPVCLGSARLCCWGETRASGIITPPRGCQALTGTVPILCGSRRSCKSSSLGYPSQDFLSFVFHSQNACMQFLLPL